MEPKIVPKMLRKLSSGAGGLRESLRELVEAQEAPQRLPRAPRENPRSVPGGPKEVQNEPQEAPNDPQEGQNEPQEGQSELREVPGLSGRLGGAAPLEIRPLSLVRLKRGP